MKIPDLHGSWVITWLQITLFLCMVCRILVDDGISWPVWMCFGVAWALFVARNVYQIVRFLADCWMWMGFSGRIGVERVAYVR